MRTSQHPLMTLREAPSDAAIISHQLMMRAGLIRKLSSGLYTWLPMGLRVLRKIEHIVRSEMNMIGALEILMPAVQPAELWEESGRWQFYGAELLRIKDRHDRAFCFGPTHEEVVTDIVRNDINSYKQLPLCLYQIQTKFRDEIRPRFGVMRAREFIMKDAYSFHANEESLKQTYEHMFSAYQRIFERLELKFRAVEADTGSIGGNHSHEFHVLAATGEDTIAYCEHSGYAANLEKVPCAPQTDHLSDQALEALIKIATPDTKSIEEVAHLLDTPSSQIIKTLIVKGRDPQQLVALLIRGDHVLNEAKASLLPQIAIPFTMATEKEIIEAIGAKSGSLGPYQIPMKIIADYALTNLHNFIAGANETGFHYSGLNWGRDIPTPEWADLRNANEGEASPCGQGVLTFTRGIEVGHIFQLGNKYTHALKAHILDESGKRITPTMGCYGIGISRIVAAAIEQNHDDKGIIWPEALAPYQIALIPLKYEDPNIRILADSLYTQLQELGYEVLLDDRDKKTSLGTKFADMDLIGLPHRIVITGQTLEQGLYEYRSRRNSDLLQLTHSELLAHLKTHIGLKV